MSCFTEWSPTLKLRLRFLHNVAEEYKLPDSSCVTDSATEENEESNDRPNLLQEDAQEQYNLQGSPSNDNWCKDSQSSQFFIVNGKKFMRREVKRKPSNKIVTKKRKKCPNESIDKISKKCRAEGKEGFGRKQSIKGRVMKPPCSDKCRFTCQKKITDVDRKQAFDNYWVLGDKRKQWECLNRWVIPKKSSHSSDEEAGTKSSVIHYDFRLPTSNKFISVCKTMFLNTLDISYQCLRTAKTKMLESINSTGVMDDDKRGTHSNRPFKVPEEIKEKAREHIRRFPVMDSHYCREHSQKQYLEEGLSVAKMYRMYIQEAGGLKNDPMLISQSMYDAIFNYEFNYSFFHPKKDRCEQCESYKNLSAEAQHLKKAALDDHLRNKVEVRRLMREDKERSLESETVCCANFDLQKILSTPRSEVSVMYYMSKLCVWNLTIFQLGCNVGKCNVWNETIGNRGSNEIALFVWKFMKSKFATGTKQFIFYTDNCGGQNRNKNMFSMYVKAANEFDVQIIHRFLEVGHTQSDGDSMHARIEKHCRNKEVFTQDQWIHLMVESKQENPYVVEEMTQEDIFNLEKLSDQLNWKAVKISKVREIKVLPKSLSVNIKYDFFEEAKKINVFKKNTNLKMVQSFELKRAYNTRIPLAPKKKKDLEQMLVKNLIPEEFMEDFQKILKI